MANSSLHSDLKKQLSGTSGFEMSSFISSDSEKLSRGNATRRDIPLDPCHTLVSLKGEGELRVVEKPDVKEAYTIRLVSFFNTGPNGVEFTSCVKLVATSRHSEKRVKEYPSKIMVVPAKEYKTTGTPSMLVKRLVLFKQLLSLYVKESFPLALLEKCGNNHIKSITVDETQKYNIIMFEIDTHTKPCYLADENNQCDCKLVLGVLSAVTNEDQGIRKSVKGIRHEKKSINGLDGHSFVPTNDEFQQKLHVCKFCNEGFVGGNRCGELCNEVIKQEMHKKYGDEKPFSSRNQSSHELIHDNSKSNRNKSYLRDLIHGNRKRSDNQNIITKEKNPNERSGFLTFFRNRNKKESTLREQSSNVCGCPHQPCFADKSSKVTHFNDEPLDHHAPPLKRQVYNESSEKLKEPITTDTFWHCRSNGVGTNEEIICRPFVPETNEHSPQSYGKTVEAPKEKHQLLPESLQKQVPNSSLKNEPPEKMKPFTSNTIWQCLPSDVGTKNYHIVCRPYEPETNERSPQHYSRTVEQSKEHEKLVSHSKVDTKPKNKSESNDIKISEVPDSKSHKKNQVVGLVELKIAKIFPFTSQTKGIQKLSSASSTNCSSTSSLQNPLMSSSASNVSYLNFSGRKPSRTLFSGVANKCCSFNERRVLIENSSSDSSKQSLFLSKIFNLRDKTRKH